MEILTYVVVAVGRLQAFSTMKITNTINSAIVRLVSGRIVLGHTIE